jgi:hypothetical protein
MRTSRSTGKDGRGWKKKHSVMWTGLGRSRRVEVGETGAHRL